jgi:hypothetical protein
MTNGNGSTAETGTAEVIETVRSEFAQFIAQERDRLSGERERILGQQRELDEQLNAVNREMLALDAYENVKAGRPPTAGGLAVLRGRSEGRVSRRGSKREAILALIRATPEGLSRGQLLERMGLKGNKSGEMSVSNALTALTKSNQAARRQGKYVVA